jgi:hypothetical protein
VTGDGDVTPGAVVEAALDKPLMEIALGDLGAPRPREVERAGPGAQVGFFAAVVGLGWVVSGGGGVVFAPAGDAPDWRSSSF